MNKPSVSVIVPVYKVESLIGRCCRSLFAQTLENLEFIFVDDCTPDRSIEVMRSVLEEYPQRRDQVKVIRMDRNSGQAAVRKRGLEEATGEYVIHCDSDDWADIGMYEKLYSRAVRDGADVVVCDMYRSDGTVHTPFRSGFRSEGSYARDVVAKRVFPALWNKLVKRDLYSWPFFEHPDNDLGEDYAIMAQIAVICEKVSYVREKLYYYYTNPASITKDIDRSNIVARYRSSFSNILHVEVVFCRADIMKDYYLCVEAAKISDRFYILRKYVKDPEIMDVWKNMFHLMHPVSNLFNEEAQLKARVMSLLVEMHIYQLFI